MPVVYMTRKETFSAAHTLNNKNLTKEDNLRIFSKCNNCHGHNYVVEVTVKGPIDPITGMCMDMALFKNKIQDVLAKLDHKNLDIDVEYFYNVVSTTENVCVYIWDELKKLLPNPDLLYKMKIFETEKIYLNILVKIRLKTKYLFV